MPVTEMLLQVETRIKRPVYSNRETGFRHPISVHSDMLLFVLPTRPFSNPSLYKAEFSRFLLLPYIPPKILDGNVRKQV